MTNEDKRRLEEIVSRVKTMDAGQERDDLLWLISVAARERRRRLPTDRESVTHKFTISEFDEKSGGVVEHDFFVVVGLYDDGTPGELFFRWGLRSDDVAIMLDQWATTFSILLQYGYPLDDLCGKFVGVNCDPCGSVSHVPGLDISFCKSPFDYVARYLKFRFGGGDE